MMIYPNLIEMRYVVEGSTKILQFRSRMPHYTDSPGTYPGEWPWQDWQDVPEVIFWEECKDTLKTVDTE
jgi:hypothetical protein